MGGNTHSSPCTPLAAMMQNFDKVYRGDYGGRQMDPRELKWLCENRWPAITGGFWPVQGSLDPTLVAQVYSEVSADPTQYAYIDSWHNAVQSKPKWLTKCKSKATPILALATGEKEGSLCCKPQKGIEFQKTKNGQGRHHSTNGPPTLCVRHS